MSSVRMCDRCGNLFSERAENWSSFTGTTRRKDPETGDWSNVSDSLDACPDCTELASMAQRPSVPVAVTPRYELPAPPAAPSSGTITAGSVLREAA